MINDQRHGIPAPTADSTDAVTRDGCAA